MRLVVQRVTESNVSVGDELVGKIDHGLLVLVGVNEKDSESTALEMAKKLSKLRVMADGSGKMNLNVKEVGGKLLVISQFTLYADTSKGNRPSFIKAAKPKKAKEIYDIFIGELKNLGLNVETGKFGEYMRIKSVLDGPVTIIF